MKNSNHVVMRTIILPWSVENLQSELHTWAEMQCSTLATTATSYVLSLMASQRFVVDRTATFRKCTLAAAGISYIRQRQQLLHRHQHRRVRQQDQLARRHLQLYT